MCHEPRSNLAANGSDLVTQHALPHNGETFLVQALPLIGDHSPQSKQISVLRTSICPLKAGSLVQLRCEIVTLDCFRHEHSTNRLKLFVDVVVVMKCVFCILLRSITGNAELFLLDNCWSWLFSTAEQCRTGQPATMFERMRDGDEVSLWNIVTKTTEVPRRPLSPWLL